MGVLYKENTRKKSKKMFMSKQDISKNVKQSWKFVNANKPGFEPGRVVYQALSVFCQLQA